MLAIGVSSAFGAFSLGSYSGHTSQKSHGKNISIKFKVFTRGNGTQKKTYAGNFSFKVIDKCSGGKSSTFSFSPNGNVGVQSNGSFGYLDYNKGSYGGYAQVTGKLSGTKASGKLTDSTYSHGCSANVTWSAKVQ